MDKLRRALSGDEPTEQDEENGFASQLRDATTMGWTSRIKGFAICFCLGFICSILAVFFLPVKGLKLFGLFYSVGNILSISSTCFLMGPWKQVKKMFHPTRVFATVTALTFLVLTLVTAFKGKVGLTFICCIIQFLAMTWYSLSYIPYGREAVLKVINI